MTVLSEKAHKRAFLDFLINLKILAFNSTEWIDSINHVAGRWRNFYVGYAETTAKLNIPIHLIYYENLKDNTIGEVKDLLQFYEDSIGFIPDHKDERIACLEQERFLIWTKSAFMSISLNHTFVNIPALIR